MWEEMHFLEVFAVFGLTDIYNIPLCFCTLRSNKQGYSLFEVVILLNVFFCCVMSVTHNVSYIGFKYKGSNI